MLLCCFGDQFKLVAEPQRTIISKPVYSVIVKIVSYASLSTSPSLTNALLKDLFKNHGSCFFHLPDVVSCRINDIFGSSRGMEGFIGVSTALPE